MKNIITLIAFMLFSIAALTAQSVSINNDGSTPDASALLDVKSTNKGMLVPRMTSAQRTAISSPANGLLVFDNTTESFWFHTTAGWTELISGDSQWTLSGANLTNNNSGTVSIGSGLSSAKFNVNSSVGNAIANFNGGTDNSFMAFYEKNTYLGYIGSYAGAINDMDFGTGGSNPTGKIHLTLAAAPAVTLDNIGLGIGTTTPSEKLHINSGNILLSNSNLGIRLNGTDRPFITRGFDVFTSGNYSGIGRWGLFMEPSRLTLGIPALAGKSFEFAKYYTNGTRTALATIDVNGAMKRPTQGNADLLPLCMGSVDIDGNILGGTGNFSVIRFDLNGYANFVYEITLNGVTYNQSQFAVVVTSYNQDTDNRVYPTITDRSGKIMVTFRHHDGGIRPQAFSFVVYKLF